MGRSQHIREVAMAIRTGTGRLLTDRTIARVVGALFIAATVFAIVGGSLLLPLDEQDYLGSVAAQEGQVVSGALIEMLMALSVIGIATMLFPVLGRRSEGMAITYVGTRIVEAVMLLAAASSALIVVGLSRDAGQATGAVGDMALAAREWTYLIGSEVMLGVSALILYGLLYAARLVPAWLSLWGLAGALLIGLGGTLEAYGVELSVEVQALVAAPIGVNEMVLAIWLIVRGFDEPADATARGIERKPEVSAAAPPATGSGRAP
jgi:Domain of unknown function (DUF4386)